ncbi:MAG: hypothetical protein KKD12_07665 [Proteobacteria bacterium]|nr:hypothetical protein [Pseudomonadota bacterium]MBU4100578.1 hypothetical protein [Pseudomonadota bacterium]MBU4209528.1 hypothetical protein [Pseudomonadota bacterium]MCG2830008.1 hypothetical protein [Desulfobacteraceae bacterium]
MAYKYKILTVFICGILLLFFLNGCARTAPRINQLKPGSVILAFGDSLTSGVGAGIDESYPAIQRNQYHGKHDKTYPVRLYG